MEDGRYSVALELFYDYYSEVFRAGRDSAYAGLVEAIKDHCASEEPGIADATHQTSSTRESTQENTREETSPSNDELSMVERRQQTPSEDKASLTCHQTIANALGEWAADNDTRENLLSPFTPEGKEIVGGLMDYVKSEGLPPELAPTAMGNIDYPPICSEN